MSRPGRQQLWYVSGFLDFAGRFAGESSRCARDEEIGVYVGPTEAEPFQSYDTSGTLLPTLSGWADEGVRPYVDCADVQADKSVRLNVGGRGVRATQLQPHSCK